MVEHHLRTRIAWNTMNFDDVFLLNLELLATSLNYRIHVEPLTRTFIMPQKYTTTQDLIRIRTFLRLNRPI